jgi:hypothetical protein
MPNRVFLFQINLRFYLEEERSPLKCRRSSSLGIHITIPPSQSPALISNHISHIVVHLKSDCISSLKPLVKKMIHRGLHAVLIEAR